MLLVTHDLALVAERAERTAVMYAGRIVEIGPTRDLLARPAHPYTTLLLRSSPARARRGERLQPIAGSVPTDGEWPSGCRFRPRCPLAAERCAESEPGLDLFSRSPGSKPSLGAMRDGRRAACFFAGEAVPV
jgi:oligopeptide/dipeptide ABC transporter ATP-binding protein